MHINTLRAVISLAALAGIIAIAVATFLLGAALTAVQTGLLSVLATALVSEVKSASAYLFDGVPKKEEDETSVG